jgi:hypothetical protein
MKKIRFSLTPKASWTKQDFSLSPADFIAVLSDVNATDDARREASSAINEAITVEPTLEDIEALDALYDSIKPEISEEKVYSLISLDVEDYGDGYTGILNCRVDEEHVQVRF